MKTETGIITKIILTKGNLKLDVVPECVNNMEVPDETFEIYNITLK